MAWQHCDQVAYYWQRGVEFLFKFTVYLRIKLHSFINDLHMYNKRYILISWREEIRDRNFAYIFRSLLLFIIEFLLLIFFFLRTKANRNEHNFFNYFAGEYDS